MSKPVKILFVVLLNILILPPAFAMVFEVDSTLDQADMDINDGLCISIEIHDIVDVSISKLIIQNGKSGGSGTGINTTFDPNDPFRPQYKRLTINEVIIRNNH